MLAGYAGDMREKTVCFTFVMGCPRSMVDAALLIEYFRQNGWKITNEIHSVHLYVPACYLV